jgi:hypothetical protein
MLVSMGGCIPSALTDASAVGVVGAARACGAIRALPDA